MIKPVRVREATIDEIAAWDQLVQQFPGWRVFHLRSWIKSIETFARVKALYLICETAGEVVGCIPGFLARIGPIRLFCSPREGWQTDCMGPVFDPEKLNTKALISALIHFLERRHRVHHIEMASPMLDESMMEELGFRGQKLFTYRVPLFPGNEAKTLSGVHSRTRSYMRSLGKGKLIVSVDEDESFVDEHYAQVHAVFARHGKSVPFSRERVAQLVQSMRREGRLLTLAVRTPDDRRCISSAIFLMAGTEMYLWSWAHLEEFGRLHPVELMAWSAMQRGMQVGCTTLDWGGGGHAKVKYGSVPDQTNVRWLRSRYRSIADLRAVAVRCYRMQQSARGRIAGFRRRRAEQVPTVAIR
jgi:hypothetical protein